MNGSWSSWSMWSNCSTSCGDGLLTRHRSCKHPSPRNGGLDCVGLSSNTTVCNERPCPIDGRFGGWTNWTTCSVSCGDGTQMRYRVCNSPEPMFGGRNCSGEYDEIQVCFLKNCPSKLLYFYRINFYCSTSIVFLKRPNQISVMQLCL